MLDIMATCNATLWKSREMSRGKLFKAISQLLDKIAAEDDLISLAVTLFRRAHKIAHFSRSNTLGSTMSFLTGKQEKLPY